MTDPCQAFLASLKQGAPPAEAPALLVAVWYGLRGDWKAAHDIAEEDHTTAGAWVHAWLHRIEGDLSNAGYWYRRAGVARADDSLSAEGERIARRLITHRPG